MKLLFPEAEVTRSLSSNLLKSYATNLQQEDTRVIAVNEIMAKRLEAIGIKAQPIGKEGFVSGLAAPQVEGADSEEDELGNIIKAESEQEITCEEAREEAENILAQAREDAARIEREAREWAEQEKEKVLAQAKEQGYAEGLEQVRRENAGLEAKFKEKEKQLEAEYQKLVDGLEPQFVDTITGIYEQIFNVELQSYRDIVCHLISTTIRKIEGSREFLIHVSKDDYSYVSTQKEQLVAGITSSSATVEVIEDMTLAANDCFIETDGGIYDCGLGTQLSELKKKLKLLTFDGNEL